MTDWFGKFYWVAGTVVVLVYVAAGFRGAVIWEANDRPPSWLRSSSSGAHGGSPGGGTYIFWGSGYGGGK